MILAVHVIGNRTAQRDARAARYDGEDISEGAQSLLKNIETHAALGCYGIRMGIDLQNAIAQCRLQIVAVRA